MADTVQVAVRIRPLSKSELDINCQNCLDVAVNEPQITVLQTNNKFTYNYVFEPSKSQDAVYNEAVKQLILKLFKGYNVTILAYGQTGSGKTYSMGTVYCDDENAGIIPRSIRDIFHYVAEKSDDWNFTISVSFIELYQEQVYDLLSRKDRDQCVVDVREDSKGVYLPGVTEVEVLSEIETLKCLQQGSSNRATGSTAMNAQSSRSHAIFSIIIKQESKSEKCDTMTSKFHLVDLAGSERSKKTKATGERFKEGVNINKGLLSLGNVISALGEGTNSYISYRDSKLTRILQDSLGGNSVTMMIACVSPASFNREETLSTLRYADRAKRIKNKPIINKDPTVAEIGTLKKEIERLRLEVLQSKALQGSSCPPEHHKLREDVKTLVDKNKILAEALNESILQSTNLFERALLAEKCRDRMKDKITLISSECDENIENVLSSLDDEKKKILLNLKQKIVDLQAEQKRSEEEIVKHEISGECNNQLRNSFEKNSSHCMDAADDDAELFHEELIMNQAQLNKELTNLNKELAQKMELASTLVASSKEFHCMKEESTVKDLEAQIAMLQKEKDDLANHLKSAQANVPSKLAEQRRKRLQELEHLIISLRQKINEQAAIIRMKESSDKKIVSLNSDIQAMKQTKVRLIQQMKFESERFRQWKIERERELCRLRNQDRRRQNELIKMENKHTKQQNVLKRKVEEAAAINKRLKEALALQKSVQERRKQFSLNDKSDKLQAWITSELEILTGTLQTEKTLEQLIEDKTSIERNLEILKESYSDSEINAEERQKISTEIQQNQEDLDLRNAQIIDLRQKINECDQESKVKAKFDSVTSLVEAKCSLKHLFDICVDSKKDIIAKDFQLQELKESIIEYQIKIKELEKEVASSSSENQAKLTALEKEYEDKILLLLYQLRDKDISISTFENSCSDTQLIERLKIQSEQLHKYKTLRQEHMEMIEKYARLQEALEEAQKNCKNKSLNKSKSRSTSNLHCVPTFKFVEAPSSEEEDKDDDKNDPDWRKTPLFKRLQKLKKRQEKKENRSFKRKSDDQDQRCSCRAQCTGRCSCVKINNVCSELCKCNGNCNNGPQAPPDCTRNLSSELEDCSDDYNSSGAAENNPNLDNTFVCDINTTFKKPRLENPPSAKRKFFS